MAQLINIAHVLDIIEQNRRHTIAQKKQEILTLNKFLNETYDNLCAAFPDQDQKETRYNAVRGTAEVTQAEQERLREEFELAEVCVQTMLVDVTDAENKLFMLEGELNNLLAE